MVRTGFEHFPHDADVGIRAFGATLADAFEQGALALTAVVTDKPVAPREAIEITCAAPSADLLFVDWLNALIYEMSVRALLFARTHVEIANGRLQAEAWGEPVDPVRHAPACEPKGATLTALRVAPTEEGGFVAQCIIDV